MTRWPRCDAPTPLRKCIECSKGLGPRRRRSSAILSFAWEQSRGKAKTMYDLIVIGGGPAGTSAAIACARNGVRVLLLERGRFPRQKVCGEFVSAESLELLNNLFDAKHRARLSDAIRIERTRVFLDGRILLAPVQPAAASIARLELDDAL